MNRWLIGIGLLVLIGLGGLGFVFLRPGGAPGGGPPTVVSVSGPTVLPVLGDSLRAEVRVVLVRAAMLSLPGGGIVDELLVAEGETVESGQPLLRLDQRRGLALVAQAEADLRAAEAAYDGIAAMRPLPRIDLPD